MSQQNEKLSDLLKFAAAFRDFGPNVAQLIDGFKQFAVADGEWSEWDESVRQELSRLLLWAEKWRKTCTCGPNDACSECVTIPQPDSTK